MALERVRQRIAEGGHSIDDSKVKRRFKAGIKNFFELYLDIVDDWMVIVNSEPNYELLAKSKDRQIDILHDAKWTKFRSSYGS
jgi:predicted ABC-type ATPase